jgi:OOP family OmpA-OmpF porin
MIQQDVSGNVASVLSANQIPTTGASVDGRDVLLTGPAGSTQVSEATQRLVASAEGVRIVNVRATDASPDASTMVAKTETQGKLDSLLAQDVVEFNPASADLTAHGKEVLDQVAPMLAATPALECEIQGHTDSQGKPDANLALSYRRAIATKNYLVNKGIGPERLFTKGYGDTQPIASNETAAGRRKNRRINFVLKEKS